VDSGWEVKGIECFGVVMEWKESCDYQRRRENREMINKRDMEHINQTVQQRPSEDTADFQAGCLYNRYECQLYRIRDLQKTTVVSALHVHLNALDDKTNTAYSAPCIADSAFVA